MGQNFQLRTPPSEVGSKPGLYYAKPVTPNKPKTANKSTKVKAPTEGKVGGRPTKKRKLIFGSSDTSLLGS